MTPGRSDLSSSSESATWWVVKSKVSDAVRVLMVVFAFAFGMHGIDIILVEEAAAVVGEPRCCQRPKR